MRIIIPDDLEDFEIEGGDWMNSTAIIALLIVFLSIAHQVGALQEIFLVIATFLFLNLFMRMLDSFE